MFYGATKTPFLLLPEVQMTPCYSLVETWKSLNSGMWKLASASTRFTTMVSLSVLVLGFLILSVLFPGSSDPKKRIFMWDCNGNEIKAWRGTRMPKFLDLAVTTDGENLISIFSDKEIRILNVATGAEHVISEQHSITSLSVSGDNKFLIVNLTAKRFICGTWLGNG